MSHKYSHRNFMIFNVSELDLVDFKEVIEESKHTIRKSIEEDKTFVKWDGDNIPSSVNSLTTKDGPYHYDEMITILSTPNWLTPKEKKERN
jgi:hypothetical protein